jgi:hypothetical protein
MLIVGAKDYRGESFLHLYTTQVGGADLYPLLADAPQLAVFTGYQVVSPLDATERLEIGFSDSKHSNSAFTGEITVAEVMLLPRCTLFYPTIAPGQGSTPVAPWQAHTNSLAPVVSLGSKGYKWPNTVVQDYDTGDFFFHSLLFDEETTYIPGETGITVLLGASLEGWRDQHGVDIGIRVPTSPMMAIHVGNGLYAQLQFVRSATHEMFVFLSQDHQDYLEVLNRTELGELISAPLPINPLAVNLQDHTYILSYRPGAHVRLYLDYSMEPVIDIPWKDKDVVARTSCNPVELVPEKATVAIGSISSASIPDSNPGPITFSVSMAAVSLGSGFNYSCALDLDDVTMEDKVYSTSANILIDVRDRD